MYSVHYIKIMGSNLGFVELGVCSHVKSHSNSNRMQPTEKKDLVLLSLCINTTVVNNSEVSR